MATKSESYFSNVFINCPFDKAFDSIFDAIVFAVHASGFIPRCAKEFDDSDDIRIHKILKLISDSCLGIHDFSRLSDAAGFPRFNMPLELGIFIGVQKFGSRNDKRKKYLVLATHQFEFKAFMSDISGQDIKAHGDKPEKAIQAIRDWLSNKSTRSRIPSGSILVEWYEEFKSDLPDICKELLLNPDELLFREYSGIVTTWLNDNKAFSN
jgi:hypothetical protein